MDEEEPIAIKEVEENYLEKNNIKEITIENEKIYLKKSNWFGWGIVKPYKIDGKINWKNFIAGGSWIKLGIIAFIILIVLGCIYEYSIALKTANGCLSQCPFLRGI